MKVIFEKGKHWPIWKTLGDLLHRYFVITAHEITFSVKFTESCMYNGDEVNGNQWNKLLGFYAWGVSNAIMVAWRPQYKYRKIELCIFYNWKKGWHTSNTILIPVDEVRKFTLKRHGKMAVLESQHNTILISKVLPMKFFTKKSFRLLSYFGGSVPAIRDMHYYLKIFK